MIEMDQGINWGCVCHLIYHSGLEVYKDCPRHMLPRPRGGEEGGEGVVRGFFLVFLTIDNDIAGWGVRRERTHRRDHSVRMDPVLQAVQLPVEDHIFLGGSGQLLEEV